MAEQGADVVVPLSPVAHLPSNKLQLHTATSPHRPTSQFHQKQGVSNKKDRSKRLTSTSNWSDEYVKWLKCPCVRHADTRRIRVRYDTWLVVDQLRSQRLRIGLGHDQDMARTLTAHGWTYLIGFFFFYLFLIKLWV